MADKPIPIMQQILGAKYTPQSQTIANIIGGAVLGGGLLGAINAKTQNYAKLAQPYTSQVAGLLPQMDTRNAAIEAGITADLQKYGQGEQQAAQKGLQARGITDTAVGREVAQKTATGLSGAYAAAANALAQAKMKARAGLMGATYNYYSDLANKQYQSLVSNYASKMGIWGSLGGIGGALLNKEGK